MKNWSRMDDTEYWFDFCIGLWVAGKLMEGKKYDMAGRWLSDIHDISELAKEIAAEGDLLFERWHDLEILVRGADEYLQDGKVESAGDMFHQTVELVRPYCQTELKALGFFTETET